MQKKLTKIKSAVVSGILAITALTAPICTSSFTPTLTAEAANDNYAKLLQYSLYFYDANMCGTQVNEKSQMTWRSDCHTSDEVQGGFHDAGDHAMFGLPQGYTASTLGWAYYEFSDAFQATGQADHLKVITDYFCDFFKRSTKLNGNSVSNFLYQKGDGNADHSYWGPPEMQGGGRKMYWTSNSASDIAAEYSAALAANYINFGNSEDLKYAEALYKFSTQYNSIASDGPKGFYNSNGCGDEQAWAAGWLYLATKNQSYLNDLRSKLPKVGWVHGWNDAHLGANCLYGEITGDWSGANGYISGKAQGSNYMFLDKWGSARINCSMQMTALIATKHNKGNYKDWAKGQMDYILGQNPANTCFVTGFASNSAKNAHHRGASGYTSYEQFNMNGWDPDGNHMQPYCAFGSNAKPLIGALVGGPCDAGGSYHDNMADYICNEVAIDYNAGLVGAAAGLYSFYKTGTLATSIDGVKSVSSTPNPPTTNPPTTTTTTQNNNPVITTTTTTTQNNNNNNQPSGSNGTYTLNVGDSYNYNTMAEKMIGFLYEDFGLTANSTEKIKKVEVKISSSNGNIGKWQGAFGTSTKIAPDYWTQTDQMEQTFNGNSGTITWNVDADTADIIQYGYGGELKLGIWWIDCGNFKIDSVTLYTDGTSAPPVTTTTTTTTTTRTTTTTTTTTTTRPTTTTQNNNNVTATNYGDVNSDGKVDINDAVLIMSYMANKSKYPISAQGIANGDVYQKGDGLSIGDANSIQKYLAKIIKSLPES